jgi:hypothetical protein
LTTAKKFALLRRAFPFLIAAAACVPTGRAADHRSPVIVEKENVPLAITVFSSSSNPDVRTRIRLAAFTLRIRPFVSWSFDRSHKSLAIEIKATTNGLTRFSFARLVFTADGKQIGSTDTSWIEETSFSGATEQAVIEDPELVRKLAAAKEAYVTIGIPGTAAPFNLISFRLSPEQLDNLRLLTAKYDDL